MARQGKKIELTDEQMNKIMNALDTEGRFMIKGIGTFNIRSKTEPFKRTTVHVLSFRAADFIKQYVRGFNKLAQLDFLISKNNR